MRTLLTGQAIRDVTAATNLTSLLTNPSGFTQLFAALDRLFAHLVQIGPPDLAPSLQTTGVWKSMSSIDPLSPDAESRAGKLIQGTRRCGRSGLDRQLRQGHLRPTG